MKIFEIIVEQPEYKTPGGIVIPAGAKTAEPSTTGSTAPAKPQTKPKTISKVKPKPKVKSTAAEPAAKLYDKVKQAAATDNVAAAAAKKKMAGFDRGAVLLLKFLGLGLALEGLYKELDTAQRLYDVGKIETQDDLRKVREFAFGVFQLQILAPAIVRGLANITLAVRLFRMLKNIGGAVASPFTGFASAVAAIGSEAFFAWLTYWLNTEEARTWLHKYVAWPLIMTGKIGDSAWSSLTGYYKKGGKATAQGISPKAAADPDFTPSPRQVAPEFVAGIRVTDALGNIIPSALNEPRVRIAREIAREKGEIDPIEAILQKQRSK